MRLHPGMDKLMRRTARDSAQEIESAIGLTSDQWAALSDGAELVRAMGPGHRSLTKVFSSRKDMEAAVRSLSAYP